MSRIIFWLWLATLFFVNVAPFGDKVNSGLTSNRIVFRLDYLAHALSFACFSIVYILRTLQSTPIFNRSERAKLVWLILSSAIIFESVQLALPYRTWNPLDLVANLIGALISIILILTLYKLLPAKDGTAV